MMKWRVKKGNFRCDPVENEDVRRSLEVLDSVLAEFDDCLESWDELAQHTPLENRIIDVLKPIEKHVENGIGIPVSFDESLIDGSTSHDSGVGFEEQPKVTSPPPVPKRNASTKLSDRNSAAFTFSQSLESLLSAHDDAGLSTSSISPLSNKSSDDVFSQPQNQSNARICSKCGDKIRLAEMEESNLPTSPFSEKKRMFEDNIIQYKLQGGSPLLSRTFHGSSFKAKKGFPKESSSEPTSLVYEPEPLRLSEVPKPSLKTRKVDPPRVNGFESSPHHAPNCKCKERIQQLQSKFAETRLLLKMNKIKGLDQKPPSFVPPPPPKSSVVKTARNELPKPTASSSNSENSLEKGVELDCTPDSTADTDPGYTGKHKLCKKCSVSDSKVLSERIEDLPKLLPTDALNRPHFGLSYSMEDDLSPGVKDILQVPCGKDSRPLSKISKTTSLSTFSLSDSSLGYVSSQSDLELNNSPLRNDKVPVPTIKFSTLPEGMDLHSLPSYYGDDPKHGVTDKHIYRDRNFNHTTDPQLRSSSAPPPPETEKPKKKHFRAFSKKEKKKNEDNVSVTSLLSSEDGVILKSLDGSTSNFDAVEGAETGVEKKRWSGLRSILGKR